MTPSDTDTAVEFAEWIGDFYLPDVIVFSTTGRRFLARVCDIGSDGVIAVRFEQPETLDAISAADKLGIAFHADLIRLGDRLRPVYADTHRIDVSAATVHLRFLADLGDACALRPALNATLRCAGRYGRSSVGTIARLGLAAGELSCARPEPSLCPGMVAELSLWSPWTGETTLSIQITGRRVAAGADILSFRMTDTASVEPVAILLASTVESFGFGELRKLGINPRRLDALLTVDAVSNRHEFESALELRLVGNRHFGRLTDVEDSWELVDRFDAVSINFVCRLGDKPVGTARLVLNNGDRDLSELEEVTKGLPTWLWEAGFVEISRLSIHPDYRSSGIFPILVGAMGRVALSTGARYAVMDCTDKLLPLYERRLHAVPLGITKKHQWSDEIEHVIAIDSQIWIAQMFKASIYWQDLVRPRMAVVTEQLRSRAAKWSAPHMVDIATTLHKTTIAENFRSILSREKS
ncbi:GNAT family N-acetyltransferase [Nocardia sp. 004]|uniref:GNAT family N-acetyltransferase n=1 Tax=Nocardia sp. 004 TaxID=3385978 RepID=UPI0039A3F3E5